MENLKTRLKNALSQIELAVEDCDDDIECALAHAEIAGRAIRDALVAHRSPMAENAEQRAAEEGTDPIDERNADQDAADRALEPMSPMEHETERREFAQKSRKKTFEQFVASKVHVANINGMIGVTDEDADGPTPGWVYFPFYENGLLLGGFHIEGIPNRGEFSLIIANSEWVDTDLAKLERILWDEFAEGETNG